MRGRIAPLLLLLIALLSGCGAAPGRVDRPAAGEGGPAIRLVPVVEGLKNPLGLVHAGDGSGRLFALEQPGRIRVIAEGQLLPEPFLDLTDRVLSTGMEQGLLGLAFDPRYRENGRFYVHYSGMPKGETVIVRFTRAQAGAERGDASSEEILLRIEQPFANHNGGTIAFGPDGYLYIALGDGGSAGDPGNRAQNLESLLGKLLRIDVAQPGGYQNPASNPFVGKPGRDEIWAYGLRNPWRFSFDRETGDLWIADVGQNEVEEINLQPAASKGGENYGWRLYEGSKRYVRSAKPAGLTFPVAEYSHKEGGCSVTGGYRYHGKAVPGLAGLYLYGDYCSGKIWGLRPAEKGWTSGLLLESGAQITAFGEDEAGELYVVDRKGTIYQVMAAQGGS